jgi:hypothetical protein
VKSRLDCGHVPERDDEVEVFVGASLSSDQCVDTPAAVD